MLCRVCQKDKPEILFEQVGKSRRKLCIDCRKEQQKAWRLANSEKLKEAGAAWRGLNKDYVNAYSAEYRSKNRDRLNEQCRNIDQQKRDQYNEARRKKRLENPEMHAEQGAKSYAKRRDKAIKEMRQYAKQNPQIFISRNAARRARNEQAIAGWSVELTDLVVAEAGVLRRLRKEATGIDWHVDHVIPLRGKTVSGLHVYNNIAFIPASGNRSKKNKFINQEGCRTWAF